MGRESYIPAAVGSMEGADADAWATGRVEGSGPFTAGLVRDADADEVVRGGWDGGMEAPFGAAVGVGAGSWGVGEAKPGTVSGGAPRSRGVYSVVRFTAVT